MYAVLGVTDRYAPEDGEIIRFAPQKYQHARYASATTDYDFSVLKLSRAVNFTHPKMAMVRRIRIEWSSEGLKFKDSLRHWILDSLSNQDGSFAVL